MSLFALLTILSRVLKNRVHYWIYRSTSGRCPLGDLGVFAKIFEAGGGQVQNYDQEIEHLVYQSSCRVWV